MRRRLLPLLFVGVGAAVYLSVAPRLPKEQHVRVVLGDAAPRVVGVSVRCAEGDADGGDIVGEVRYVFAPGRAPRIVSYEPRLAGGDYLVEIDVETDDRRVATTDRRVRLAGGTTSIDVSR